MSYLKEVVLGFIEKPKNKLILTPEYTPSKVGGQPALLCDKSIPSLWCKECGYKYSFLMQVYANLDDQQFNNYHRMLYIFLCLSDKCIGT